MIKAGYCYRYEYINPIASTDNNRVLHLTDHFCGLVTFHTPRLIQLNRLSSSRQLQRALNLKAEYKSFFVQIWVQKGLYAGCI